MSLIDELAIAYSRICAERIERALVQHLQESPECINMTLRIKPLPNGGYQRTCGSCGQEVIRTED